MKILWLTWKDRHHPLAGGAETVSGEIMHRLVRDGHEVTIITAKYNGSVAEEKVDGISIYRVGNRYTVYLRAKVLYNKLFKKWPDLIVDEMNTLPFGSAFYSENRNILLFYQLAREVWFHQMIFPISLLGYLSEPLMLKSMSKVYKTTLTESNSSKKDIEKYGFSNVRTFRVGISLKPVEKLKDKESNIVLSLGSIRPMKRTLHAVKAFEIARDDMPQLKMLIAGDTNGSYAKKVVSYISKSRHSNSIEVLGRISNSNRLKLMQQADIIIVTSVKEGWGLIVTEASSQGTPAIAYDVDGLRDSIKNNETGILSPNSDYEKMGKNIVKLLSDKDKLKLLQVNSWQWSKEFTFENSYRDFMKIIEH